MQVHGLQRTKGLDNAEVAAIAPEQGRRVELAVQSVIEEAGLDVRRACQVQVNGDCTIETRPSFNWSGEPDKKGKYFWETPYPNK